MLRSVAPLIPCALLAAALAGCTATAQGQSTAKIDSVIAPVSSDPATAADPTTDPPTKADPPATTRPPAPTHQPKKPHPKVHPIPPKASKLPTTGQVVVLDPGHNGGNGSHPEIINQPVPAGNGTTKPCNTTGTATDSGYSEHAFNWAVALRVRTLLRQHGVTVIITRPNDTGVGPCVDKRAAIGNAAHANAVVSIHGDGAVTGHGFHIMRAVKDLGTTAVDAASGRLATDIHGGMLAESGMTPATYAGTDGYDSRSDLAGLNLSSRPTIMIECGNMRNSSDAARMSSVDGRDRIADAIAKGIEAFLITQ